MSPPPYVNPVLSGLCMADGSYAYTVSGMGIELPIDSLTGHMISLPGSSQTYIFSVDPRYVSYQPGMTALFSAAPPALASFADPAADVWESRRLAVLEDLAKPFPPDQYEVRDRLVRRLQSEGLNAGNAREIGSDLESIGLKIPRPPRAQPAVAVEAPPLPRLSEDMEREAALALAEERPLQSVAEALPENVEVYRFDRTRKIRSAQPVGGSAYSNLDRTLIVIDGTPGGTFSIDAMNQTQWDAFRSAAVQRGYAVTNPRADGTLRTDARTLEYHIIADAIDAPTLQYFRENHPYVRVVRYSTVADIAAGRGEVLIDSPRQYLRSELEREGTLHDVGDFVEVRNGDTVVRRFPRTQVTSEFYHYEGRLTSARAAELRAVAESRGWDLSRIDREQSAELLNILQGAEHGWNLEEIHSLIGSEGMRSFYNYGTPSQPFGFSNTGEFQAFRTDVLDSLQEAGLPIRSGEARVILSGSAMSGFSSKGGQFRWSDSVDSRGNPRAASDYDIKVIVPEAVFNEWVERSIAAQPSRRQQNALRHYIPNTDGIRWAELPASFRDALAPLLARNPRIQQVTIALDGGYWHVQDPMADAEHIELTENRTPSVPPDPTSGTPVGNPQGSAPAPAADPLIRGADAAPTGTVNRDVVRSQLVLRYPHLLSQTAREALLDGRSLPTGPDLINSSFTTQVDAITDAVVARYAAMGQGDASRVERDRLWREQTESGFLVRDGVPDRLLTDVTNDYIARESHQNNSPFAGGVDEVLRADSERGIEADAYERNLRDLMRHIGR